MRRCLRVSAILGLALSAAGAADDLKDTLQRMDSIASGFKGLRADLRQVAHTAAIDEDTVDTGTIAVRRNGPNDVRILVNFHGPNAKTASIAGRKVEIYYPKISTVQEYDIGRASSMKDQLMMLAFGSTSRDLERAYTIQMGGPDKVSGEETMRIVLVPKDKELLQHFPKVELWFDQKGRTVQQKLHGLGGDYNMATYTNIQFVNLPESAVKLDLPRNVHRERPQK